MQFSSKENDEVTITEPKIHASVFARIIHGAHAYAPIGLPEHYAVATDKGEILDNSNSPYETTAQAKSRAEVQGFSVDKMTWPMYVGLPLRRTLAQPWFKPIARIGSTGNDEYPLDSVRRVGRDVLRKELVAELTARTTGELFLYVNDAVIGLPGIADSFYVGRWKAGRNAGTARIKVKLLRAALVHSNARDSDAAAGHRQSRFLP